MPLFITSTYAVTFFGSFSQLLLANLPEDLHVMLATVDSIWLLVILSIEENSRALTLLELSYVLLGIALMSSRIGSDSFFDP